MALQVRRTSSLKVRVITTLMMVFALVAQPLYGLVSTRVANAITVDTIPTMDVSAPAAPTIIKPVARQWFKTTPIKTEWSIVSDPSGIDHYQIAYGYDDGHKFSGSDCSELTAIEGKTVSGCRNVISTSRNHSPAQAEEGGVTIWVRAIDGAGNVSPWSGSVHYYYDHTNPSTDIVAPTGTVGSSFTISGDAKDNLSLNRVYVQLVNRQDNKRYGGTTINLVSDGADSRWSKIFDANALNLPDGNYAAHVSVTDMAGNSSSAGWTANFTVDSIAPIAAIVSHNNQDQVSGIVTLIGEVSDVHPMNTHFLIKGPNKYSKTDTKKDGRAQHQLTWDTSSLLNGEYSVQFETRDQAGNKAAISTEKITLIVNNSQPIVTGENFNTHSDTDYKGINVGFNIANFKTVTDVSVALYDAEDNLLATNTHNQKLLDLIEGGETRLSTPFIGTAGTYIEEFWNLGTPTWSRNDKPAKAIVTVFGTSSADVSVSVPVALTQLSEANDVTFESTLPLVGVVPVPTPTDDTDENLDAVDDGDGTLPLIINQLATASPLPGNDGVIFGRSFANAFTSPGNSQTTSGEETASVLGVQTTNENGDVSDIAKNVAVIEPSADGWKFFGLAWYWLALLIAAIAVIWYAIARRRNQDA